MTHRRAKLRKAARRLVPPDGMPNQQGMPSSRVLLLSLTTLALVPSSAAAGGDTGGTRYAGTGGAGLQAAEAEAPHVHTSADDGPVLSKSTARQGAGVFPIGGAYTWGGRDAAFGADRGDHIHEGQDLPAAAGTRVRAPTAGTVTAVDYQPDGAGYFVVMRSVDGRDFFFAHLRARTVVHKVGQVVRQGATLAGVGSSGASFGAHLHFEIWEGGWRAGRPVDPAAQLRQWAS